MLLILLTVLVSNLSRPSISFKLINPSNKLAKLALSSNVTVSSTTTFLTANIQLYDAHGASHLFFDVSLTVPGAVPPLIVRTLSLIFQSQVPHLPDTVEADLFACAVADNTSVLMVCTFSPVNSPEAAYAIIPELPSIITDTSATLLLLLMIVLIFFICFIPPANTYNLLLISDKFLLDCCI